MRKGCGRRCRVRRREVWQTDAMFMIACAACCLLWGALQPPAGSLKPTPFQSRMRECDDSTLQFTCYVGMEGNADRLVYKLRLKPGQQVKVRVTHTHAGEMTLTQYSESEFNLCIRGLRPFKTAVAQHTVIKHGGDQEGIYYLMVHDRNHESNAQQPMTLTFEWSPAASKAGPAKG